MRCIAVTLTIVATAVADWKFLTDMMVNIIVMCTWIEHFISFILNTLMF